MARSNLTVRNNSKKNGFLSSAPLRFKLIYGAAITFIALVFIMMVFIFATIIPKMMSGDGSYSYKVEYQIGDSSYTKEVGFGN